MVHASIADEFIERFVREVTSMRIGEPSDDATQIGTVISMDHLEKVEFYINLAIEEGGRWPNSRRCLPRSDRHRWIKPFIALRYRGNFWARRDRSYL